MPRKKLEYTHHYPYHVIARSNNKDWFYLPMNETWKIFASELSSANLKFCFQIHAFVLMKNHYHLVCSCSKKYPLSKVMEWFQRSVNRKINDQAQRINHVFGGPYKGSLITTSYYYHHALRYVYQNPVKAEVSRDAISYKYSSLNSSEIPLTSLLTEIGEDIPKEPEDYLSYLNNRYSEEDAKIIQSSLAKVRMKWPNQIRKDLKLKLRVG